jgi:hypothetical protein
MFIHCISFYLMYSKNANNKPFSSTKLPCYFKSLRDKIYFLITSSFTQQFGPEIKNKRLSLFQDNAQLLNKQCIK